VSGEVLHDRSSCLALALSDSGPPTFSFSFSRPLVVLSDSRFLGFSSSHPLVLSNSQILGFSSSRPLEFSSSRILVLLSFSRILVLSNSRSLEFSFSRILVLSDSRPLALSNSHPRRSLAFSHSRILAFSHSRRGVLAVVRVQHCEREQQRTSKHQHLSTMLVLCLRRFGVSSIVGADLEYYFSNRRRVFLSHC